MLGALAGAFAGALAGTRSGVARVGFVPIASAVSRRWTQASSGSEQQRRSLASFGVGPSRAVGVGGECGWVRQRPPPGAAFSTEGGSGGGSGGSSGRSSGSLFDKLSEGVSPAAGRGGVDGYDPRVYKLNEGEHVQLSKPQAFAKAVLRQAPISPRKLKPICSMLMGLSVEEALLQCRLSVKKGAKLCEAVIKSAASNAVHNHGMTQDLYIASIFPTKGRWRKTVDYAAKGRTVLKLKYFSHLTVTVAEGKPQKKKIRLRPSALQRRARRMPTIY